MSKITLIIASECWFRLIFQSQHMLLSVNTPDFVDWFRSAESPGLKPEILPQNHTTDNKFKQHNGV